MDNKKFSRWALVIGMIGILLLCVFLALHEKKITKLSPDFFKGVEISTPSMEMRVNIDFCEGADTFLPGADIAVNGWVALTNAEAKKVSIHVLLRDRADGTYYKLPTAVKERPDVTVFLNEEAERLGATPTNYNYDYSGFSVRTGEWNLLNLENTEYELFLLYVHNDRVYLIDAQRVCRVIGE